MSRMKRLLLIDDDPLVASILLLRIKGACPDIAAETTTEPEARDGYDVYIIDNDFGGQREGLRLAEAIATVAPRAAVLMLSSHLDVHLLKRAMGVHCRGAFDKREPDDITALIRTVSEIIAALPAEPGQRAVRGTRTLVGEMTGLIREWNRRIGAEERRKPIQSSRTSAGIN